MLRSRLDSYEEYDRLCAANLIFQLILDKNKELVNIVNSENLPIRYEIAIDGFQNNLKNGFRA